MEDSLAKKVIGQMDLCTRMIMQQNEAIKKWETAITQQNELLKQRKEAEFIKNIHRHFPVMDVVGLSYVRVGRPYDGGYVMVDDFAETKTIYSGGICDDVSWELEMASRCQADIFMYDHTIDALPESHPRFHFFRTGLTGKYDPSHPELETLPRLIEQNGHTDDRDMILKLDIEGYEYSAFGAMDEDTLTRFSQIVLEFHGLLMLDMEHQICYALDKLNATHQLVYVHGNNNDVAAAIGGKVLPMTMEATYLRKDKYRFKPSTRFFPTAIDMPNIQQMPEIILGYWGVDV